MGDEITSLESPVDAMHLIHRALSDEAASVQQIIEDLEPGASLHPFRLAFNFWASALMFHADAEDRYMTAPMADFQPARDNEAEHLDIAAKIQGLESYVERGDITGLEASVKEAILALHEEQHTELMERLEDVLAVLDDEIGRTQVIARTKRHLYGKVVALKISQDDHFESEEAFVLPEVRARMSESQQLEVVKHLLLDEESEDPRWILDWVQQAATTYERGLLTDLEARFDRPRPLAQQSDDYPALAADS